MSVEICERVSVNFLYNHLSGACLPKIIKWKNRVYTIQKLGLHYTLYRGTTLFHMFAVSDHQNYFLLAFNTKNLTWTLEEVGENNYN